MTNDIPPIVEKQLNEYHDRLAVLQSSLLSLTNTMEEVVKGAIKAKKTEASLRSYMAITFLMSMSLLVFAFITRDTSPDVTNVVVGMVGGYWLGEAPRLARSASNGKPPRTPVGAGGVVTAIFAVGLVMAVNNNFWFL